MSLFILRPRFNFIHWLYIYVKKRLSTNPCLFNGFLFSLDVFVISFVTKMSSGSFSCRRRSQKSLLRFIADRQKTNAKGEKDHPTILKPVSCSIAFGLFSFEYKTHPLREQNDILLSSSCKIPRIRHPLKELLQISLTFVLPQIQMLSLVSSHPSVTSNLCTRLSNFLS